jgi:hypothetical protein
MSCKVKYVYVALLHQVSFHVMPREQKHKQELQSPLSGAATLEMSDYLPRPSPGMATQQTQGSELLHLCRRIGVLTQQVRILQGPKSQAAVGVLPEVQR